MKHEANEIFAQMKNEDRKFGERAGKNFAGKNKATRQKHRVDFKNFSPRDLQNMNEDMEIEEEFEEEFE